MNYFIVYEPDYSRVLPAILIDCRASIPEISNKAGSIIKSYTDIQVGQIGSFSVFYKIETDKGTVAGVFWIDVNTQDNTALLRSSWLRPAFAQFSVEINEIINNFIALKQWSIDFLF